MKLFSDLVKDGVAPSNYTYWGQAENKYCAGCITCAMCESMCRAYNNYWGLATDTHATPLTNESFKGEYDLFMITGSMIDHYRWWDDMTVMRSWRCVDFPKSFVDFANDNGLTWRKQQVNGAMVVIVSVKEPVEEPADAQ